MDRRRYLHAVPPLRYASHRFALARSKYHFFFSGVYLPRLFSSLSSAAIPFVLRFLQCLRKFIGSRERWHIVNGGKYARATLR
jgi:hypothetical protein